MGIFQNILKSFKNSKVSAEVFTEENVYDADYGHLKPGEYQVFMDRVLPKDADIKQMKASQLAKYPMINDPYVANIISMPFGLPPDIDRRTLMQYVKYTPEIVSIFNAIIEDIISDGYDLIPEADARGTGKTLIRKAEKFLQKNNFKELLASSLWDALGTGDAYIYKARVTPEQIQGLVQSAVDASPIQMKSNATDYIMMGLKQSDEDIFATKSLELVPSSTVQIKYTSAGVISYVQRVGMKYVEFTPEEIIHIRLWRVDGKMYGFTPMQSITREIDILTNVKDYARYFFEKGGVPNYLFIFPEEAPNSPSVKAFKKTLQLYASLVNKYKNIIATGKIEPIELNKMTQDMQFQQLAVYLTQVIVMAWQVPSSRLSDMLVAKGVRGATIATEGYYRKISHMQDVLEDIVNNEILASFKVKLKFNKTYLQDELREIQGELFRADAVYKKQSALRPYKKRLTEQAILKQLNLKEDDVEEGETDVLPEGGDTNRQSFERNAQLLSQDQEKLAQDKDKQKIALQKSAEPEAKTKHVIITKNPDGTFSLKV